MLTGMEYIVMIRESEWIVTNVYNLEYAMTEANVVPGMMLSVYQYCDGRKGAHIADLWWVETYSKRSFARMVAYCGNGEV